MPKRKFNYKLYIKSHCEAPDYEVDIRAKDRNEAINIIWNRHPNKWEETGWSKTELRRYCKKL